MVKRLRTTQCGQDVALGPGKVLEPGKILEPGKVLVRVLGLPACNQGLQAPRGTSLGEEQYTDVYPWSVTRSREE